MSIQGWLMKSLKLKSTNQAYGIMFAIIAICFGIALFLLVRDGGSSRAISPETVRTEAWMVEGHVGQPPSGYKSPAR